MTELQEVFDEILQGRSNMPTAIQLSKVTQTRIARLAQAAGRSPAATLRFVLRDGFEAVERSIQENALADAEFAAGSTVTHVDVMDDAQKLVRQAKRHTRATA
jgi:predicted transcriptional regulator